MQQIQHQQRSQLVRQQKSPRTQAYSPDYSSPYSSHSLLPARLDQNSFNRMGQYAKENQLDVPLPVFQDRESQMIPQVTQADSNSGCGCAQVLSDMSDEMLIRQLQLNMNEKPTMNSGATNSSCSIALRSSYQNLSSNNQPLAERKISQYANSPAQQPLQQPQQQHLQQKVVSSGKFVSGQVSTHTWQNNSPINQQRNPRHAIRKVPSNDRCVQSSEQKDDDYLKSGKFYPASSASNVIEHMQVAPEPHPYPIQHELTQPDATDSLAPTETMPTDQKQTSPAISTDSRFATYINTVSAQSQSKETSKQQEKKAQDVQVKVQQFFQAAGALDQQNSTIEEQPTQEQLQGSTTAKQINRHSSQAKKARQRGHSSDKFNEPMILGSYGEAEQQQHDSESLAQIRLINDAMRKKFPSNYSPNKSPDMSGSLQDFSMDAVGELLTAHHSQRHSNDYCNAGGFPLTFGPEQQRAMTNQNSFSYARMNVPQKHLEQPQHPMASSFEQCRDLNLELADQQVVENQKAATTELSGLKTVDSQKNRPSVGKTTLGFGEKNSKNSVYEQCQTPSQGLYQPILSEKKKEVTSQSKSGLPAKLDFFPSSTVSNRNKMPQFQKSKIPSPSKPNYQSSVEPQSAKYSSFDTRTNATVRRNLEPQLASSKTSLSPASSKAVPFVQRGGIINNAALSTMLNRYAFTKRTSMQSRERQMIQTDRRLQNTLSKQSPSPIPLSRTRNEETNLSRSLAPKKGELANLQTSSQASLVHASDQQLQFSQIGMSVNRSSFTNLNAKRQNANQPIMANIRSPMTRTNQFATITATQTRKHSSVLDEQYQQQLAQTLIKPQLPVPTRASLYQLRRVIDGMRALETNMFLELERIKKPTAAVLAIARMTCVFFEALRQRDAFRMDQVQTMHSWQQIQIYIRNELTCQVPEFRNLLRKKVVAQSLLNSDDNDDLEKKREDIKNYMEKIQETYFAEAKMRVIRRYTQTSKLMKSLVQLIYAFVCLTLDHERDFNIHNLMGLTEQPVSKFDDVKAMFQLQSLESKELAPIEAPLQKNSQREQIFNQQNNIELVTGVLNQTDPHDQNGSQAICASCSCHMQQESHASLNQKSILSKSSAGRRSADRSGRRSSGGRKPKQSLKQLMQTVGSPETKYEMQMQVFGTLDQDQSGQQTSFMSKNSQSKRVKKNSSVGQLSASVKSPADPSRDKSASMSPHQTLNVNNYSTLQIQKPVKPRTSTPDDLMNVMETYGQPSPQNQAQQVQTLLQEELVKEHKTIANRSSRRQFSVANLQKLCQPKHFKQQAASKEKTRNLMASVNSASDFVSIVKASAQLKTEQTSARHSPKSSRVAFARMSIATPKQIDSAGAISKRQVRTKVSQAAYSSALAQAGAPTKRERKDVSPITTPKAAMTRRLAKDSSNFNSASQKRFSTIQSHQPQIQSKPVASKHVRNTTLYKSTACAAAKQKQSISTSRPSLQKDSSANKLPRQQIVPQAIPSEPQKQQVSRKNKSQTQNTGNVRRSTTPQSRVRKSEITVNDSNTKAIVRKQKKQATQRHPGSFGNLTARNGLADFVATEKAVQIERKMEQKQKQQEVCTPNESVPSFGGVSQDKFYRYQHSTIVEEESSINVGAKYSAAAPLLAASFTPEKQREGSNPGHNNVEQEPWTPQISGLRLSTQQETAQLGKYFQAEEGQEFMISNQSSIVETPCAQLEDVDNRQEFIMAKAQAITENINSCYKQHNMPQIDMVTIQKLKMRRLQFMSQACAEVDADQAYESEHTTYGRFNRNFPSQNQQPMQTQQSCNVQTTMTVELTAPEDEDVAQEPAQVQEDNSFTDALYQLRAEVESLMKRC